MSVPETCHITRATLADKAGARKERIWVFLGIGGILEMGILKGYSPFVWCFLLTSFSMSHAVHKKA